MNKKNSYIAFYVLVILLFLFGAGERLLFIRNYVSHPTLSFNLPQTDQFNYQVMAEDQLQKNIPALKMTVYPVYLGFVKTVYHFFGVQMSAVFYLQLFLSLISVFWMYGVGCRLFNRPTGLISALLFLYYKMNFQYDAELLPSSLSQFFIVGSLYSYIYFHANKNLIRFALCLIFFLFLGLFRPFMWIALIPLLAYSLITHKLWKRSEYLFLLILWGILSGYLFQKFHTPESFFHKFGMMFYMANLEKSSGLFTSLPGIPLNVEGHVKNSLFVASEMAKTNEGLNLFWINKALSDIASHPFSFIQLTLKKLFLVINDYEIHNNTSIYFVEKQTILEKLLTIPFSVLIAGGLTGILLSMKRKENHTLIWITLFILLMILTMPLCSRYRLPLIPFLALFSGLALSRLMDGFLLKNISFCLRLILIFVSCFIVSILPAKELHKSRDLQYWESIENRKEKYLDTLKTCRDDLSFKKLLSLEHRVNAIIQLGRLHNYREFFVVYQEIMKQTLPDSIKIRLQKQYAILLETVFQFSMAKKEWENLSQYQELKSLCIKKIEELSVYEKYLEIGK